MKRIIKRGDHYCIDVLEDLLSKEESGASTITVCLSRDDFVQQLLRGAVQKHSNTTELSSSNFVPENTPSTHRGAKDHALFVPSLANLAASEKIKLVFCSTIPALRAQLASLTYDHQTQDGTTSDSNPSQVRKLIVLNLLALHHGTSEYTLQGLSTSFAAVVSAAHQAKCNLELFECKDVHDPENTAYGDALWDANAPLLSGSIRLAGSGAEWASRTIIINQIARRWFEVEHAPRKVTRTRNEEFGHGEEQEEMLM